MSTFVKSVLTAVALVAGLSAPAFADDTVKTRFGDVAVYGNTQTLTFNHAVLKPSASEKLVSVDQASLADGKVYSIGDVDAVVVSVMGGSMCPQYYRVVLASKAGARVTPMFSDCSEDFSVKVVGGKLNLVQPAFAFRGMPAPPAGKVEIYVVDPASGVVTHDGKAVK